jgi:hypothetical integral membrane protein (TIGR02206 family)
VVLAAWSGLLPRIEHPASRIEYPVAATQFVPFGAQHFLAVAVALGGATGLSVGVRASGSARLDRVVRWLLAAACVVYEAAALVWRWRSEFGGLAEALPLHLCDLSLLLAPVVLLTARRPAYELLYFWGIGGAAQSLATPTLIDGFPARTCICFFVGHTLIIASALYTTVVMRLRPVPRSLPRVWLITTTYGLLILPVNVWLGTNYLYIAGKPLTPSLLDWLGPWPWYILSLQPIVVAVILVCYLPFFVLDRRRGRGPERPRPQGGCDGPDEAPGLAKRPAAHYHTPRRRSPSTGAPP